jgi:hypothetical protein
VASFRVTFTFYLYSAALRTTNLAVKSPASFVTLIARPLTDKAKVQIIRQVKVQMHEAPCCPSLEIIAGNADITDADQQMWRCESRSG